MRLEGGVRGVGTSPVCWWIWLAKPSYKSQMGFWQGASRGYYRGETLQVLHQAWRPEGSVPWESQRYLHIWGPRCNLGYCNKQVIDWEKWDNPCWRLRQSCFHIWGDKFEALACLSTFQWISFVPQSRSNQPDSCQREWPAPHHRLQYESRCPCQARQWLRRAHQNQ